MLEALRLLVCAAYVLVEGLLNGWTAQLYHYLFSTPYTVLGLFSLQLLFALKAFSGVAAIVPRWEEALKFSRSKLVAVSLLLVEWTGFVYFWCASHCSTNYLRLNAVVVTGVILVDAYFAYVLYSCSALGSEGRIDVARNQVLRRALRVQAEEASDGLFVAQDVDEAVGYPPDHGKLPPVQVGIPVADWTQNQIVEQDL